MNKEVLIKMIELQLETNKLVRETLEDALRCINNSDITLSEVKGYIAKNEEA